MTDQAPAMPALAPHIVCDGAADAIAFGVGESALHMAEQFGIDHSVAIAPRSTVSIG